MSRTPRRSPAAVPHAFPRQGAPVPLPGAGPPGEPPPPHPTSRQPPSRPRPGDARQPRKRGDGQPCGHAARAPGRSAYGVAARAATRRLQGGKSRKRAARAPERNPYLLHVRATGRARRRGGRQSARDAVGREARRPGPHGAGTAPAGAPPHGRAGCRQACRSLGPPTASRSCSSPCSAASAPRARDVAAQCRTGLRRADPARGARAPADAGARPVVRDIGWFVPREGAIEAFARIGAGDRLRAMAFRLERGRDLRWRCTAVELGGPR